MRWLRTSFRKCGDVLKVAVLANGEEVYSGCARKVRHEGKKPSQTATAPRYMAGVRLKNRH